MGKNFAYGNRIVLSHLACFCSISAIAMVTARATAQDVPANASTNQAAITISDEPKTIDPGTLVPKSLAANATVTFAGVSVREVTDWIREHNKITVLIDHRALIDQGVSLNDTVTDQLQNQPLYLLLNRLRGLGLDWYVDDSILHITTAAQADQRMATRPYNVAELLNSKIGPDSLIDTIVNTIAVDSWEELGGDAVVEVLGDVLFVRQSEHRHLEVKGLLSALTNHGRQTYVSDPAQHIAVRQKLLRNISVSFDDAPLEEAVKELAHKSGVDLRLDMAALRQNRIRGREPVTLHLSDRSLDTVLHVFLAEFKLAWVLRDGVLWITSEDVASEVEKTAVYDVRDLCRDESESGALRLAITNQTGVEKWIDTGGSGNIVFPLPGTMVVINQEDTQRQVLDLLEKYRSALRSSKPRQRKVEPETEVLTRYYQLYTPIAVSLETYIPQNVFSETWITNDAPNATGTITLLASSPEPTDQGAPLERSVLVIRQTRTVHDQIGDIIQKVTHGDSLETDEAFGGGRGGGGFGGGGFGGGFF